MDECTDIGIMNHEEIILNKAPVTMKGLNSRLQEAFVRPLSGTPLGKKPKPVVEIKRRPSSAIVTTTVNDILCSSPISRKETIGCLAQPKGKESSLPKQLAAISSSRTSSARTVCISPRSHYLSECSSNILSTMEKVADVNNNSVTFASQVGDKTSDQHSTQTRRGSSLPPSLCLLTRRKKRSQSLHVGLMSNGERWGSGGEAQWEHKQNLTAHIWSRRRNMVEEEKETDVDKVRSVNLWLIFIYPGQLYQVEFSIEPSFRYG